MVGQVHPSDEQLMDLAHDPSSLEDRDAIEKHLVECEQCSTKFAEFKAFDTVMRDPDTWWLLDDLVSDRPRHRSLREFKKRLSREDADAKLFLGELLESQYRFTYANILRRRRAQSGGVVRLLTARASDLADRDPRFAIELSDTARAIAETLPDDFYPAGAVWELRGTAWKEYAVACRYRGWLPQGLDALDRAERAYRHLLESTLQVATVNAVRALIFWEQGKNDKALEACQIALEVFRGRSEVTRYRQVKEIEANILHRQGHVATARDAYLEVYSGASAAGDADSKARASRNLAVAYTDLGDTTTAKRYLSTALEIYTESRNRAMVAHTRWAIFWTHLVEGDADTAAKHLPDVIAELAEVGLSADAARAQLDFAEALFVLGRFQAAADACATLGAFFRRANMLSGALTAAAFLKEASAAKLRSVRGERRRAETRPLEQPDFLYVRKYLTDVRSEPSLPFHPPQ
jgi:tetratricopeptide (TPR) repeat protein